MAGRRKQALPKLRSRSSRQTVESLRQASSRGRALRKQALAPEREALEQQAATADILRALSNSNTNPQPVFEAIVEHAHRLTGALYSVLYRYDGRQITIAADRHVSRAASRAQRAGYPRAPSRDYMVGRTILEGRTHQSADLPNDPRFPGSRNAISKYFSRRALMTVPLLRDGVVIGAIGTGRAEAKAFTKKEIKLLETFAAEAVIAIEKVRLFNETKEALERQTATSEILRVMSSSPADLQPVFNTIARNFIALSGAAFGSVYTYDGNLVHHAGGAGLPPEQDRAHRARYPVRVDDSSVVSARTIRARAPVHVEDALADAHYDPERAKRLGVRRILGVPMLREGEPLGALTAGWYEAGATPKQHEELLQTFAAQAAIAIENVRLFNETKEALEQQTATADILGVISRSPTDIQPVLRAVAESASRLCEATDVHIRLVQGELMPPVLQVGNIPVFLADAERQRISRSSVPGRAILDCRTIHIHDIQHPEVRKEYPDALFFKRADPGFRTILVVPLVHGGNAIGSITVRRAQVRPFSNQQVKLLQTFADQAVIAIENVRLFKETKEALERQTATAEILGVISGSPTDLLPIFKAILASATRLCDAHLALLHLYDGDAFRTVAHQGGTPEFLKWVYERGPFKAHPQSRLAGLAHAQEPYSIADMREAPAYQAGDVNVVNFVKLGGARSYAVVPLVKDAKILGAIAVYRSEVEPFIEKHVQLVKTFANQAVIAIENVRLFNETKEALERQTATAEILKVIASSPSDVQPVFEAVAQRAAQLCNAGNASVSIAEGTFLRRVAVFGHAMFLTGGRQARRTWINGRAFLERRTVHVEDVLATLDEYPETRENQQKLGFRTIIAVPMIREGKAVGTIGVWRREVKPFSKTEIELLETFAAQAVIAIENTRLFNETKEALARQTATAEMLKVIAGLPSDEQPVFDAIVAHAGRIVGGCSVNVSRLVGDKLHLAAYTRISPEADALLKSFYPISATEARPLAEAVRRREPFYVADFESDPKVSRMAREVMRARGFRSTLYVPIVRGDAVYGVMHVSKVEPGPFPENWVEILKIFADQAVIAIENVRLFKEIQEKSAQLEVASHHKSQFLASMSHELRTPLNAILGFNEMMLDGLCGEVPAGFKDPLDETQTSGKHLLRLINNVLDLAKIEAGRMELALADYSVHDTVESVRSTLRQLAAEKGLEFLANVPVDLPLAYGDAGRITQCLMNLAGNSLKFTKEGRVEISVQQQNGQLRYCVADTGIGIPPERIGSLFTEFKQTDPTIASEYGGTGLGLSITKKFIEMHGGRIWVESEIGKGSAFIFEIPVKLGK